jgi:HEPN domain
MFTPQELRTNARSKLQSAEALLALGDFDNASYLAGYAVEFSLKARYCTRKGLSHFPKDFKEAKSKGIGHLFIHDLEKLLTLSEGQRIPKMSMKNIDWAAAMDWSEQKRYSPIGTATQEVVVAQIAETRKLITELTLFEVVEKLAVVEKSVSSEKGRFLLFAVAENVYKPSPGWQIVMSAWWLDSTAKFEAVVARCQANMDADLVSAIADAMYLLPAHPLVQRFNSLIDGLEHSRGTITKANIIDCVELPPAYLITSCQIPRPDTSARIE